MADEGEMAQQASGDDATRQLGDKWGEDITAERQAWLEERLQAWDTEVEQGEKRAPFDGQRLTGADAYWLAARSLAGSADEAAIAAARTRLGSYLPPRVPELHLEGANLFRAQLAGAALGEAHLEGVEFDEAHLEGAALGGTHLEGAAFAAAHLEGAHLESAHLEGAALGGAHLEGAGLFRARLEGAALNEAHLEGAVLIAAHLEGANFREAHLENATLFAAHLERADLREAHLEGADLREAHLEGKRYKETNGGQADLQRIRQVIERGHIEEADFPDVLAPADLRLAFFDRATRLQGAKLGDADLGYVRVADTRWGKANLAAVSWLEWPILYDEIAAREWKPTPFQSAPRDKRPLRQQQRAARKRQQTERLELYRAATRANRQLATVLRAQGLNDEADKLAYRAQVLQRTVLRLQHRRVRWVFSGLLDGLAGYGYKPERSLYAYLAAILGFAAAYFILGQLVGPHLSPLGSVVFSMTSFHGRGFFPGGIALDDPLTVVAAVEAFAGLVIEVSFIATFTQRFFAR